MIQFEHMFFSNGLVVPPTRKKNMFIRDNPPGLPRVLSSMQTCTWPALYQWRIPTKNKFVRKYRSDHPTTPNESGFCQRQWSLHCQVVRLGEVIVRIVGEGGLFHLFTTPMTPLFEGQALKRRPKIQAKQGAPFGFEVYDRGGYLVVIIYVHPVPAGHASTKPNPNASHVCRPAQGLGRDLRRLSCAWEPWADEKQNSQLKMGKKEQQISPRISGTLKKGGFPEFFLPAILGWLFPYIRIKKIKKCPAGRSDRNYTFKLVYL